VHIRIAWDLALEVHRLRRIWLDVSGTSAVGGSLSAPPPAPAEDRHRHARAAYLRLIHAEQVLAHVLVEHGLVTDQCSRWTRSVVLLRGEQSIVVDVHEACGTEPMTAHARLIERVVTV
jgi:hypothetical protein